MYVDGSHREKKRKITLLIWKMLRFLHVAPKNPFFFPHIETAQGKFSGFCISPKPGWWKLNVTGGALNNQGPSGFGSGIKCSKNIIISFGPMRKDNASRAVEGTHSNK